MTHSIQTAAENLSQFYGRMHSKKFLDILDLKEHERLLERLKETIDSAESTMRHSFERGKHPKLWPPFGECPICHHSGEHCTGYTKGTPHELSNYP